MKNLLFIIIAILVGTSSVQAQKWWQTALVDGAGALGGAGSVMSFTGGIASTTPVGWVGVGVGAVIGGAGASIAYADSSKPTKSKVKSNSNNSFDYVGINHNLIVLDFYETGLNYSPSNFIQFIEENKSKYNINENEYITVDYLSMQDRNIKNLKSNTDFVNFVTEKLPNVVDKKEFVNFIDSVKNAKSLEEATQIVLSYENDFCNKELEQVDKNSVLMFLSTFRNSISLWYN